MNAIAGHLLPTWPGPFASEARAAYERARTAGLSTARALVLGCIASFKQGWTFRRTLANHTGVSIRTVQRSITQGKVEGLLGTARAKPDEVPPGLTKPMRCGWSHRWIIGWGKAVDLAKAAVESARLRRLAKTACQGKSTPHVVSNVRRRSWTVEELDAELERMAAKTPEQVVQKPPD